MNSNNNLCDALNQKFILLQQRYCNSFDKLYAEVSSKTFRHEYSKGGLTIHRGFYTPSSLYLFTGNCKKGRLLKVPPQKRNFDYEYIFDNEGRIICSKKYSDEMDNIFSPVEVELFVYDHDKVLSFIYEPRHNNNLFFISECHYSDGILLRYENAICDLSYGGKGCSEINIESFEYSNDGLLKTVQWQRYLPAIHFEDQCKYTLFRDENNCLSTYTVEETNKVGDRKNIIFNKKRYSINKG